MQAARDARGEVLIVTGMSGAGRSTVANALEDLDWYVVDNLPPRMLTPLLELTERAGGAVPRVAVVVDVRGRSLFGDLPEAMRALQADGQVRVVFLDASDAVLVRRFEAVRRPHPLQGDGTILDGIRRERERHIHVPASLADGLHHRLVPGQRLAVRPQRTHRDRRDGHARRIVVVGVVKGHAHLAGRHYRH